MLPRPRSRDVEILNYTNSARFVPLLWSFGIANVPKIRWHHYLHYAIGVYTERVFEKGPVRFLDSNQQVEMLVSNSGYCDSAGS
jgi:hypothetical protein